MKDQPSKCIGGISSTWIISVPLPGTYKIMKEKESKLGSDLGNGDPWIFAIFTVFTSFFPRKGGRKGGREERRCTRGLVFFSDPLIVRYNPVLGPREQESKLGSDLGNGGPWIFAIFAIFSTFFSREGERGGVCRGSYFFF